MELVVVPMKRQQTINRPHHLMTERVAINYGCTIANAINYNPIATIDDGSCESFDAPLATPESVIAWNNMV